MFPLVVAFVAAVNPQTAEAVARAAAVEAAQNPRFDVVSELDVKDMVDFEANKQLCGSTESCASQLAGAYDARLVLFLSLYNVDTDLHAQLTLRDLKSDVVVHRADAAGVDERALFAAVQTQTADAVARFVDFPAEGRVRLFVSRAAVAVVDVEVPAVVAAPAPPSSLLIGGGIAVAAGAVVGVSGLATGVVANNALKDAATVRADKDNAQKLRAGGYVGAVVGLVVLIGGSIMAAMGTLEDA
ncbi:MAG: hypothetical protein Q8O67_04115 [Deltaproteobacteria bacterium]|nr:hypothetical protein [Deltaproteobacteria bacterium]